MKLSCHFFGFQTQQKSANKKMFQGGRICFVIVETIFWQSESFSVAMAKSIVLRCVAQICFLNGYTSDWYLF